MSFLLRIRTKATSTVEARSLEQRVSRINWNTKSLGKNLEMASANDYALAVLLIFLIGMLLLLLGVCCKVALTTSTRKKNFFFSSASVSRDDGHEGPVAENHDTNETDGSTKTRRIQITVAKKESQV